MSPNPNESNPPDSKNEQPGASSGGETKRKWVEQLPSIILAVSVLVCVVVSIVVMWGNGTPQQKLELATGYALLIFLFFLSLILLLEILTGKINLSELLDELSGGASMSRFQLLIFTIVVAFSFFIIVVKNDGAFPDIPGNVLVLLGLSASTYGVSKGLQVASGDTGNTDKPQSDDGGQEEVNKAAAENKKTLHI